MTIVTETIEDLTAKRDNLLNTAFALINEADVEPNMDLKIHMQVLYTDSMVQVYELTHQINSLKRRNNSILARIKRLFTK